MSSATQYDSTSEILRNGDLTQLVALLRDQSARSVDVVASASKIRSEGGIIHVADIGEPVLTEEGVTTREARLQPGAVFDEGIADKLKIPVAYVRRLRAERPDLYDANVNGWLHGDGDGIGPDARKFFLRSFVSPHGADEIGFARALLSDKFNPFDNFDVLTAALSGVRAAGVNVEIAKADLTERRLYVKVNAPEVKAYAHELLKGYKSPFSGASGDDNPVVSAGFVISNSEVGNGAASIVPQITVEVCTNGLTITKDATKAVHLGARLDEGVVRWSDETKANALKGITLRAEDAVKTYLDVEYVQRQVALLEEKAGKPITGKIDEQVKRVAKASNFTEAEAEGILDHFIRGGQITAGGVLQAVTSFAQTVEDADAAYALEEGAIKAFEFAAAL